MFKEIRTLIKRFTPKLIAIKDAKGETLTENDDILARWKKHCEGLFTKYGNTGASTTDCDDNEQDKSSETTDEDDEELIPLRSEAELAVKQLKNGKATGCDDISADMIKASGDFGIYLLHKPIVKNGKQESGPMTGDEQFLSIYQRNVIYNSAPTTELFR